MKKNIYLFLFCLLSYNFAFAEEEYGIPDLSINLNSLTGTPKAATIPVSELALSVSDLLFLDSLEFMDFQNFASSTNSLHFLLEKNVNNIEIYNLYFLSAIALYNEYLDKNEIINADRLLEELKYYMEKAISFYPNDTMLLHTYVNILTTAQENKQAALISKKILEINPSDTFAHYYCGIYFLKDMQLDKAIFHFKNIVYNPPQILENPQDLFFYSTSLAFLGDSFLLSREYAKSAFFYDQYLQVQMDPGIFNKYMMDLSGNVNFKIIVNTLEKNKSILKNNNILLDIYMFNKYLENPESIDILVKSYPKSLFSQILKLALKPLNEKNFKKDFTFILKSISEFPYLGYQILETYRSNIKSTKIQKNLLFNQFTFLLYSNKDNLLLEKVKEFNLTTLTPTKVLQITMILDEKKHYDLSFEILEKVKKNITDSKSLYSIYVREVFLLNMLNNSKKEEILLEDSKKFATSAEEKENLKFLKALSLLDKGIKNEDKSLILKSLDIFTLLPKNQVKIQLAICYYSLDQKENFQKIIVDLLKNEKDNPIVYNLLAVSFIEKDKTPLKALPYIDKALEIEPQNIYFLDTKAWLYVNMHSKLFYEKAYYLYDFILKDVAFEKIDENYIDEIYYHIAFLYYLMDNTKESLHYIEKALKINENNSDFINLIQKVKT